MIPTTTAAMTSASFPSQLAIALGFGLGPWTPPPQHWVQNPVSGNWVASTSNVTWVQAEAQAVQAGGHLVAIRSSAEEAWLRNRFQGHWIGINSNAACQLIPTWTSGEPAAYVSQICGFGYCGEGFALDGACASRCWSNEFSSTRGCIERTSPPPPSEPGGWSWLSVSSTITGQGPSTAVLANLNSDTTPDLVWTIPGALGALRWRLGAASPQIFGPQDSLALPAVEGFSLAELDGNGRDDVVTFQPSQVRTFLSTPTGALVPGSTVFVGGHPRDLARGRFDGDALEDIVVLLEDRLRLLVGDGMGGLTVAQTVLLPSTADVVLAGDLDDDGDTDLLLPSRATGDFLLYANQSGTFVGPTILFRGFAPSFTELVDMNGDGRLDILTLGEWSGWKAQVLIRTGPSTFSPLSAVPVTSNPTGVQVSDLDGNGTPDLLVDASTYPQVVYTSVSGQLTPSTTFDQALGRPFALNVDPQAGLEIVGIRQGPCTTEIVVTRRNVTDCNQNGIQDLAEILLDPGIDLDADGTIDVCESAGSPYCFGDGTGAACPCDPGQAGAPGGGCRNSFGGTGTLGATGNASVGLDSVTLRATGFLPTGVGLLFQGNGQQAGGLGGTFGDGLLCVNQSVVRLMIRNATAGVLKFGRDVPGDPSIGSLGQVPVSGGTRHYQIWYRDPAPFCTSATFNLTNGVTIPWQP